MTVEQELIDLFASTPGERNREILVGYYGWEDGRQHTLTEIGARFGITRERVRQVCAKLTKRIKTPSAVPAPALDRALALIAARLPCPAAQIEAEMLDQGLTAAGISTESVAVGAKLLGRGVRFKTVKVPNSNGGEKRTDATCPDEPTELQAASVSTHEPAPSPLSPRPTDGRLVIRPDQLPAVLAIVDLAKKEVYFHGLARVEEIERAIAAHEKQRVGLGLVRQTLQLMDGFCWLDEATGWFRLRSIHKHGLPKAVDKVLAVAGSVMVSQLRAALGRNRRLWKEPPPENVLLQFCGQMPEVRVEADRIISDPPRDWKKALTGVEAKLVRVLLDHGPVMERGAMEDLCVAGGMNRFSFHAFVSWSPVIAQYGHSVYGLLGTEVLPQQVEALLAQRRTSRLHHRVLDNHGRTEDGKVWLGYRLSKAASTYAVITVPAALKKVVRGRFQLLAPDGRPIGTLATKDGRAWGLGAFLRERGARIGDHIILTLDLEKGTAIVTWDEKDEECSL